MVAGVIFTSWSSNEAEKQIVKSVSGTAPYEPGMFYKRDLPCIHSLLEDVRESLETIVVDSYVSLGGSGTKGLGMHL